MATWKRGEKSRVSQRAFVSLDVFGWCQWGVDYSRKIGRSYTFAGMPALLSSLTLQPCLGEGWNTCVVQCKTATGLFIPPALH